MPLQRGLEFLLHPKYDGADQAKYGGQAWHLLVAPRGSAKVDYLWPVSGPVGTARHQFIGPAFGWTAEESLAITPRSLRFVLNEEDYQRAERLSKEIIASSNPKTRERPRLGKGLLRLHILSFEREGESINGIEIRGESCVPTR